MMLRNKEGALELSIGTIVVIVIGMSMLVLGLVLVRTIFTGSTESINVINDRVKDQITGLFADEGSDIAVNLGQGKRAKVSPGDETFGVSFGARTPDGSAVGNRERLQYELVLDTQSEDNCVGRIGGVSRVEDLFITPVGSGKWNSFDEFEGSNAFALVEMQVPEGTAACSQKVFINVRDSGTEYAGNFFVFEVVRSGLFN